MKKQYTMPAMQVVEIQQTQMLCGSPGASRLSLPSSEGISWEDDGIEGDDY